MSEQFVVSPAITENTQFIEHMQMRVRIMGGPAVALAFDCIACPNMTQAGALKLRESLRILQDFARHLSEGDRKKLLNMLAAHINKAMSMQQQDKAGGSTNNETAPEAQNEEAA